MFLHQNNKKKVTDQEYSIDSLMNTSLEKISLNEAYLSYLNMACTLIVVMFGSDWPLFNCVSLFKKDKPFQF